MCRSLPRLTCAKLPGVEGSSNPSVAKHEFEIKHVPIEDLSMSSEHSQVSRQQYSFLQGERQASDLTFPCRSAVHSMQSFKMSFKGFGS